MDRPPRRALGAEWAPVAEAPGYLVSRKGAILGKRQKVLSPCATPQGYLKVALYTSGAVLSRGVHRLVAAAFVPNPGGLPHVVHLDGDRSNNCAHNLAWAGRSPARPAALPGHAQRAIEEQDECAVCLCERAAVLFEPCGHVCCCAPCAAGLRAPACPICRQPIAARRALF